MKEFWKKIVTCMILAMLLTGSAVSVSGCQDDSPTEEAVEDTGDAIEDAGDEVEDAVD
jgi:hypothetical protein